MPKQPKPALQPIASMGIVLDAAGHGHGFGPRAQPDTLTDLQLLIASIVHEINQPLSGILTNANACRRMLGAERPNIDGALETVRRTIRDVERAVELISRLRALFDMRRPVIEPVGLNEAVLEALALARGELDRSRIAVQCNLGDAAPHMLGDRILLQQVILNLIRNAIEAMAGTTTRNRVVTVSTWQDAYGQSRLSVHDVGPGISPLDAERIFKPLFSTKPEGMGMGLCISRTIVERHGGRLWATPNSGAGTTFWLSMPSREHGSNEECQHGPRPLSIACPRTPQTAQAA